MQQLPQVHLDIPSSGTQSRYTAPYQASVKECFTQGDPLLIPIGVPDLNYLSEKQYGNTTMYSDHAPIIYNLSKPSPIMNPYISIITWNVGQFGDGEHTYNGNGHILK